MARATRHTAMRQRRPVLHDQHPAAAHRGGILQRYARSRPQDLGGGVEPARGLRHRAHIGFRRRIGLGDDDDLGHAQHRLAGVPALDMG